MSVQIEVNCSKCGERYNYHVFQFCPSCNSDQIVDLRSPTQQIQDTTSSPEIGKNHCQ
jgi:primosomal protein N'